MAGFEKAVCQCRLAAVFCTITLAVILLFSGTSSALDSFALPTGGKITSGRGNITKILNLMTVTQSSEKMIAKWDTFDIGSYAGVTFLQRNENSVALNRIYDGDPSQILGTLLSNGKIFLINPNGIVFGKGSQLYTGGLVASSLNISDEDFLNSKYVFTNNGSAGSVINQGNISVKSGGVVALIAPSVTNKGTITATSGDVVLAAGNQVTLNFSGNSLLGYTVDKGVVDALAENKGFIKADGGRVVMTAMAADSITKAVVNNSGVIEARTLKNQNGRILLLADNDYGQTTVDGRLDASAPNGGNGGLIETSGASVKIKDTAKITTAAPKGETGTWLIDPYDFTIAPSGGDVTGTAVSNGLASNNVTIRTQAGSATCTNVPGGCGPGYSGGNGDIFVNDSISWSSNRTLTLNAYRNIEINQPLTGSGTAVLALLYGQGTAGTYTINAPIDLPAGNNFSTKNGAAAAIDYTVITFLGLQNSNTGTDLQGMRRRLNRNYALGADIDATPTSGWIGGFLPVGTDAANFTGRFEGLGHTISGLTINRTGTDYVGLFGYATGSTIQNINLTGGSIAGRNYVGGLVGRTSSTVVNASTTGNVTGAQSYVGGLIGYSTGDVNDSYTTGTVTGGSGGAYGYVGGLIGYNTANISNSHATGTVSGPGTTGYVGGLVGYNTTGGTISITDSYATGNVSGTTNVGGLIGNDTTTGTINIINSYATGNVTGTGDYIGGLIGYNVYNATGTINITDSYATGTVNGVTYTGGLVGRSFAVITNCYATGNVTGSGIETGGLIGRVSSFSTITGSYATGTVKGTDYTGGLAGRSYSGITNSYATGSVTGTGNYTGGLVGANDYNSAVAISYGSITNSYAAGNVSGSGSYIGGLIGQNGTNTATITNAYAIGSVTGSGTSQYIGGLAGYNYTGATITNAYATGSVTGGSGNVGGFAGNNAGTVTASYWDTITTGKATGIGGGTTTGATGRTTAQMMQSGNFSGWTFGSTPSSGNWFLIAGNTRPFLQMEYKTNIINAHQLQLMAMNPAASYTLGKNIDMSELTNPSGLWGTQDATHATTITTKFVPIGNDSSTFTGTFNGQGYTITNLAINRPTTDYVGLFGYIGSAGAVSNVGLVGGSVTGQNNVGQLAGFNYGNITKGSTSGSVTGIYEVGGLVGFNAGTITRSYATGAVKGTYDDVGGLVGGNYGTISDSYAQGSVTGVSDSYYVGGLVGYHTYGTVSTSYATGSVSGSTGSRDVGGLIGGSSGGSTSNSFWDTQTSMQTVSAGGTGKTTAEMKTASTYTGWDTTNIWTITNGSYPSLK